MQSSPLVVTQTDLERLREHVQAARSSWRSYVPTVEILEQRLRRAQVVSSEETPGHTITMNSRFRIRDLRTGQTDIRTLAYPWEADEDQGRWSVLSPFGLAALGTQVGDFIWWNEDESSHTARIEDLCYQPESAGDRNL